MDSAVRTGARLPALLARVLVTAGFVVAAWLLSSLMAGSASASTPTDNDTSYPSDSVDVMDGAGSGLLGGLLGGVGNVVSGLTHSVGGVVGGTTDLVQGLTGTVSGSDDTGGSAGDDGSAATTLPALLPGVVTSTGTASTSPAAISEPRHHNRLAVRAEPRPAKADHHLRTILTHHAVAKREHGSAAARRPAKAAPTPADDNRRAGLPLPPAPPAPQAPPAPSTTVSSGHDSDGHGKSALGTLTGAAALAPPAGAGTAVDHRATAVDQHHGRPGCAPD